MARPENDEKLARVEATQAALRESIEQTKALAADSDRLLRRHRAAAACAIPLKPDC